MKKKVGAIFIIIVCIAIILFSYVSWNTKLGSIKKDATKVVPFSTSAGAKDVGESNVASITMEELKQATANSAKDVQKLFENRLNNGQNVKMLIIGSQAMDQGDGGYAKILKDDLQTTYGSFINVTSQSFDTTSADFIAKHLKDIKWKEQYDIVLLEPFILNDNGLVSLDDEFSYIDRIVGTAKKAVKDVVVVIQPSYPIYGTSFYETNVAALNSYAKENSLPYINHWKDWPSSSDPALNKYLTKNNEPNKKGSELWAAALSKYFTNQ